MQEKNGQEIPLWRITFWAEILKTKRTSQGKVQDFKAEVNFFEEEKKKLVCLEYI